MSNPALPPLPEPKWPLNALADIAAATVLRLGASRAWIALRSREGALVCRIAFAPDGRGGAEPLDPRSMPPMIARALTSLNGPSGAGAAVENPDLHVDPALVSYLGSDAAAIRAFFTAPLLDDGRVIGALVLARAQPGTLADHSRQHLFSLADQAVMAIRSVASAERDVAQARELNALLAASQALTSTLDSDEVFQAIIESIQQVITCESALIYRYNERAETLRVIASMGQGTERLKGAAISVADNGPRVCWVARSKRPYMGVVGPADQVGEHTNALSAGGEVSLLCMPLISKGKLRGVASLARPMGFGTREVDAMERLSPIAAAALENVELFHQSQAARQQLEALFASASDGFALIDDTLNFTRVNPAFEKYVAAEPGALLGQQACKVFNAATSAAPTPGTCLLCRGAPDCLLRQVLKTRAGMDHVECQFPPAPTPRAGRTDSDMSARPSEGPAPVARTIDFSLTPMYGQDQRPRVLLVGRDVSGPREVERFRAEQIQLVSHEMGSPLQAVAGNIELFISYYGQRIPPEQLRLLETSRATAFSIQTLVEDLDLISRKDAGVPWNIPPRRMDLAEEARAAANELYFSARQKGVELYFSAQPNLAPAWMDPARARQVARNLINNAIKFTPSGGRVQVGVHSDSQWVALTVADTGVGIPEDKQELIWQRFYRAKQPGTELTPGRGLGLAIVRIIAEAYGGRREAQPNPNGQGTIFTVSFPRADRSGQRA